MSVFSRSSESRARYGMFGRRIGRTRLADQGKNRRIWAMVVTGAHVGRWQVGTGKDRVAHVAPVLSDHGEQERILPQRGRVRRRRSTGVCPQAPHFWTRTRNRRMPPNLSHRRNRGRTKHEPGTRRTSSGRDVALDCPCRICAGGQSASGLFLTALRATRPAARPMCRVRRRRK